MTILDDDILHAASDAIDMLATTLLALDDHTRHHGHEGCPTCRQLTACVEWLAALAELQRDAAHLLRQADVLVRG